MKLLTPRKTKEVIRTWGEYSSELLGFQKIGLLKEKREELAQKFSQNYFQIRDKEIENDISSIFQFLKEGRADIIVPMREKDGTIKNLLSYVSKRVPSDSILVVNDRSNGKALGAVEKFKKVMLINKDEVLETIDWERLLLLLNLSQKPEGKGMTVVAGYLFRYLLGKQKSRKSEWVFQTDADIKNHKRFRSLEYLTWGALNNPGSIHIKIAKPGRNNESHMAVRSSLAMLEDLDMVIDSQKGQEIGKRATQLFENLAKYKWILGGTLGITDDIANNRPFATGYLEETLICAFAEDVARTKGSFSVQVSNPNPCSDGDNNFKKENTIVQMAANFVITLVLARKPVCDWTLEDIAWINKNLMARPKGIALIPPKGDEDPVIAEVVANERIMPSIKMMEENGFINEEKSRSLLKNSSL